MWQKVWNSGSEKTNRLMRCDISGIRYLRSESIQQKNTSAVWEVITHICTGALWFGHGVKKSLLDWNSSVTTYPFPQFLCPATVSRTHPFICVIFVPWMTGRVVSLDLWNHYGMLDISTWSLSQDYKVNTSPTWQMTLHAWLNWGLYKNTYCTIDLNVQWC